MEGRNSSVTTVGFSLKCLSFRLSILIYEPEPNEYNSLRNADKWTRDTLSGFPSEARPKGEARFKFSLDFLLRSQKIKRGMKTSANNPPTTPPTIAPTRVCDDEAEVEPEVEAGGVKTRVGMEARLENEGVYVMKSKINV